MPDVRNIYYTIKVSFSLFDTDESNLTEEVDSFVVIAERKLPISNSVSNQEQLNELIFGNSEIQDGSDEELSDNTTTEVMIDIATDIMDYVWHRDERLNGYTNPGMLGGDLFNNIHLDYANKTIVVIANYFKDDNNNNNYNNSGASNNNNNNSNNNNNNNLNNKLITKRNNNNNNNNNSKNITNTITGNIIENGNIIGNFHNESSAKRYYKRSTVKRLLEQRPPINPYTRAPLKHNNVTYYKARLPNQNGGRRAATKKVRSIHRKRKATRKQRKATRKHRK